MKTNKIVKNIIKAIIYMILILLLLIVLTQRITGNEKSFLGYKIFRVISASMYPEYKINDILLVKDEAIENINVGDNIVYIGDSEMGVNAPITHKVIDIEIDEKSQRLFHTKGIANSAEDPIVKPKQIYGVVKVKMYFLSFVSKIINNIYGFIVVIIIPIIVLIIKNVKELISMSKEKIDERKENND